MRVGGNVARAEIQKVLEIKSYSSSRRSCEISSFYCWCAAGCWLVGLKHVAGSYRHVRLDGCGSRFIVAVLTAQRHDHDPPQQGVCTPSNHCALEGRDYQFFCNYVTSYMLCLVSRAGFAYQLDQLQLWSSHYKGSQRPPQWIITCTTNESVPLLRKSKLYSERN